MLYKMTVLAAKPAFGMGKDMDIKKQEKAEKCFQLRRNGILATQPHYPKSTKSRSQQEVEPGTSKHPFHHHHIEHPWCRGSTSLHGEASVKSQAESVHTPRREFLQIRAVVCTSKGQNQATKIVLEKVDASQFTSGL